MNRLVARRDDSLVARITGCFELRGAGGAFVRAGSALVRVGGRLLAIQDDALAAVWIDPSTRALEPLVFEGAGAALAKHDKPDFEAAFADGAAIWVLGSGATPRRRRVARIEVAAPHAVTLLDASRLYEALEAALGMPPNIEGAVPLGDRVRLFHRGPGRRRDANFMLEVPRQALAGARADVPDAVACDLGALGGLSLGFTDALALGDSRVLYLAAAEDTPDGIADGPVAGAAIGIIDGAGARWAPLLDADGTPTRRKVEGVALDPGARSGWLITDPDDPARPAELCRLVLGGL